MVGALRLPLPASTSPQPLQFEQQPQVWWDTLLSLLDRFIPSLPTCPIETITVDGTSGTLLLANQQGDPLTPALMYNDSRAQPEAHTIATAAPAESGAHGANASLAKLLHLLDVRTTEQAHVLALHQADWINGKLTGKFGWSDENNALKMGYDPIQRCWPDWMETLAIASSILPDVVPAGSAMAPLHPDLCRRWSLTTPPTLCAGTTDSVAATLATGITSPGDAVTSLGTTLVLKILANRPLFAPEFGIYSHRLGEQWLISGASNAGGGILLDHFTVEALQALGKQIDPNHPTGLDYYPLPSVGERFPIADPTLAPRLTPRPEQPHHFLQALLEGLTAIEQQGYRQMIALGAPVPNRILTTGGGIQNQGWMRLRTHHLPWPIETAATIEAAYGAALLGYQHAHHSE